MASHPHKSTIILFQKDCNLSSFTAQLLHCFAICPSLCIILTLHGLIEAIPKSARNVAFGTFKLCQLPVRSGADLPVGGQ